MKCSILIFLLSDKYFAFEIKTIKEIVHMAWLFKPPGTPVFLKGFLNLENIAVPVLSLAKLLDLAQKPDDLYSQIVIHNKDRSMVAFAVDKVLSLLAFSESEIEPVCEQKIFNGCIKGVIDFKGEKAYLLSFDKILLEQEKQIIEEFQQKAQKRLNDLKETV